MRWLDRYGALYWVTRSQLPAHITPTRPYRTKRSRLLSFPIHHAPGREHARQEVVVRQAEDRPGPSYVEVPGREGGLLPAGCFGCEVAGGGGLAAARRGERQVCHRQRGEPMAFA